MLDFGSYLVAYEKAMKYGVYRFLVFLLGLPVTIVVWLALIISKNKNPQIKLNSKDLYDEIRKNEAFHLKRKYAFFKQDAEGEEFEKELNKFTKSAYDEACQDALSKKLASENREPINMASTFRSLCQNPVFKVFSIVFGILMYLLLFIFKNYFLKYTAERIVMLAFVIFGVTIVVFSILYISPMDPARNILGQLATDEQVEAWKEDYGMNDSYLVQAGRAIKNVVTFDFGSSFVGGENVIEAIARKFPVTLKLAVASLIISILIAVPAGIISAVKQYSTFDFVAMVVALIGISIPNFWLGLMMILLFSVKLGWLNVIYSDANISSLIMPAIVIGTSLAASVARMTRSSMLEVIKSDYIVTARAKGLSETAVILKHALKNAIIPIITIIGLQFGVMLGGAAVSEKVFTIPGIGSYIVNKQMIPDIPAVLAGVVYIAIVVSVANLAVDLMYAVFDPRIKAKIKKY